MAIRILSGIIVCGPPVSFVRIGFNPHQLIESDDSDNKLAQKKAIGPNRDFTKVPAKHVALRQLLFQRRHGALNFGEDISQKLIVIDTISASELRVTWDASVDLSSDFSRIIPIEISYMVIGEVADK